MAPSDDDSAPSGQAATARRRRPSARLTAVAVALALLGGSAGAYVTLRPGGDDSATAPVGITTYSDEAAGYRISHPAAWRETAVPDGVLFQISGQNAASVKKIRLEKEVDAANIDAVRAVTDATLSTAEAHLTVLKAETTTVAGLPGIYYLYSFPSGDQQGAHTHYFFFNGRDMYTIVFQALPADEFAALAPDFDAVLNSFELLTG